MAVSRRTLLTENILSHLTETPLNLHACTSAIAFKLNTSWLIRRKGIEAINTARECSKSRLYKEDQDLKSRRQVVRQSGDPRSYHIVISAYLSSEMTKINCRFIFGQEVLGRSPG